MKKQMVVFITGIVVIALLSGWCGSVIKQGSVDQFELQLSETKGALVEEQNRRIKATENLAELKKSLVLAERENDLARQDVERENGILKLAFQSSQQELFTVEEKLTATETEAAGVLTELAKLEAIQGKPLEWWPTVEALEKWVADNELAITILPNTYSKREIDINLSPFVIGNEDCMYSDRHAWRAWFEENLLSDPRVAADEYAKRLIGRAELQGYRLMEVPVTDGRILFGGGYVRVNDFHGLYVGTLTKVNGVYYYVEPLPLQKRVVRVGSIW